MLNKIAITSNQDYFISNQDYFRMINGFKIINKNSLGIMGTAKVYPTTFELQDIHEKTTVHPVLITIPAEPRKNPIDSHSFFLCSILRICILQLDDFCFKLFFQTD